MKLNNKILFFTQENGYIIFTLHNPELTNNVGYFRLSDAVTYQTILNVLRS